MFNRKQLKLICIWCAVIFLAIFAARLVYQGVNPISIANQGNAIILNKSSNDNAAGIKNYASSRMEYAGTQGGATQVVDQKYEKIANLSSNTAKYEEDEAKLYHVIEMSD